MTESNGARRRNDVNWSRFGLAENVQTSKQHVKASNENERSEQTRSHVVRELFDEEVWHLLNIYLEILKITKIIEVLKRLLIYTHAAIFWCYLASSLTQIKLKYSNFQLARYKRDFINRLAFLSLTYRRFETQQPLQ
jgi:hypothetical protein